MTEKDKENTLWLRENHSKLFDMANSYGGDETKRVGIAAFYLHQAANNFLKAAQKIEDGSGEEGLPLSGVLGSIGF